MNTTDTHTKISQDIIDLAARCFSDGMPIYALKNIDKKQLNHLYGLAYSLYNKQEYRTANDIFKFLCLMDHYNTTYWLGLAHTRKLLKLYDGAINCFGMLFLLDPDNPNHPVQAAECHLAMNSPMAAKAAIDHASFLAAQITTDKSKILQEINNLNKIIKNHEAINETKAQKATK